MLLMITRERVAFRRADEMLFMLPLRCAAAALDMRMISPCRAQDER